MVFRRPLAPLFCAAFVVGALICGSAPAEGTSEEKISFPTVRWDGETARATSTTGKSVALALSRQLQEVLNDALRVARPISGAAVMIDAQSGAVLAAGEVGSSPKSLLFHPVAPAASLFKIVTTAALFEHTDVTPMTRVCTRGGHRDILQEHLTAPRGEGVHCDRFAYALGVSRNAAYAQLATQKLTRDALVQMASELGFGKDLLLDAPGQVGSLEVPYNDLDFARTAAGFENSQLSVFGGAQLAFIVANGGELRPLHFQSNVPALPPQRVMSERTARRLRSAMEVTIHSGTARESFVDEFGHSTVGAVQVAGKTGTLKPGRSSPTASWFIGFAPSENPRVIVSVVLQNPDKWYRKGHQVGRDLIKAYLKSIGVSTPK